MKTVMGETKKEVYAKHSGQACSPKMAVLPGY